MNQLTTIYTVSQHENDTNLLYKTTGGIVIIKINVHVISIIINSLKNRRRITKKSVHLRLVWYSHGTYSYHNLNVAC